MKQINQLSIFGLIMVLALSSCSLQKRVYTKGFNINWFENHKGSDDGKLSDNHAKKAEKRKQVTTENAVTDNSVAVATTSDETPVVINNAISETVIASKEEAVISKVKAASVSNPEVKKAIEKSASASKPMVKSITKQLMKKANKNGGDVPVGLLYVLCFLIPWLAVGLVTDWDIRTVVINLLWTLLCGIPGIIHAIIVVHRES